jgi:fucose permease
MSFFGELHRRNVVRVAVAYTVICWVLLQVADVVLEGIGAPEWVMKTLLLLLLLGLIPAVVFAWVFELTPEGLKRESEIAEGALCSAPDAPSPRRIDHGCAGGSGRLSLLGQQATRRR